MKLTPAELDSMVNELDADGSGEVDFDEFMETLSKDLVLDYSSSEIGSAFKLFSTHLATIDRM